VTRSEKHLGGTVPKGDDLGSARNGTAKELDRLRHGWAQILGKTVYLTAR
jgi:hypothetical protein